jgi:hypothetical protein
MQPIRKKITRRTVALLAVLAMPIGFAIVAGGASAAQVGTAGGSGSTVTSSSLGT